MDAVKARIEELKARLAELRAGEQTIDAAREILKLRGELKDATAELTELEAAFAEGDDEAGDDAGEGEGSEGGDAPAETPAEQPAQEPHPGTGGAEPRRTDEVPAGGGSNGGSSVTPIRTETHVGEEEGTPPVALAASGSDVSPTVGPDGRAVGSMTITASSNMGGVRQGAELGSREEVLRVLQAASNGSAHETNGKARVIEISRWAGDDMQVPSDSKSAIENSRIIANARKSAAKPLALQAGGCFCGPDELIRETGVVGDRGRPVAGVFPSIPISGGFRAMPDLAIGVDTGTVNQWTCADQDLVDPADAATWKPCTELDCFTEQEYVPYMVTACTTVRRQHRWAHPEQVDAWLDLIMIEYDRLAETLLLDKIELEAGNVLTVGTGDMLSHGVLSQFLYALGNLSFALGYQFRSDALEGHTVIIPKGAIEAMLTDELLRGFPSGVRTEAEIRSLVTGAYGVRLVERLDESTALKAAAAATVTALNAGGAIDGAGSPLMPPAFRMYVIRPDQWVHGEGVLVGADWHVDNALLRQNKLQWFLENVEILELLGVEKPYVVDIVPQISGAYSDLVAPPTAA